jgi:hypothetical protein
LSSSLYLAKKKPQQQQQPKKDIDVTGRDFDINDVMDETEAALRAAEEALTPSPPPAPEKKAQEFDFDIDGLLGDAEEALQAAEEALQQPKPKVVQAAAADNVNVNVPADSQVRTPKEEQEILASTLGGIVTGIFLGVAAFEVFPDLDMDVDLSIPPIIASVVFGIAYYTSASKNGSNGAFVRSIVGKPMQAIGNGILGTIAATGNAMTSAAQRQVEKAAQDIKAIPGRAADAASRKATEVVEDIKATPGRVVDGTRRKVVETVDSVKKEVDDAVSITKRAVEKVLPKKNKQQDGEEE